jgi:hypothetical protein
MEPAAASFGRWASGLGAFFRRAFGRGWRRGVGKIGYSRGKNGQQGKGLAAERYLEAINAGVWNGLGSGGTALHAGDFFAGSHGDHACHPGEALVDDLQVSAADVFRRGVVHTGAAQYPIADVLPTAAFQRRSK